MWALPLTLAACLLAGGRAYFFESGYTHHYTYKAENDLLGQGNITTILKFQVSAVNETENGHRLHSLTVDSLVQFMKGGPDHEELLVIKKAMVSVFSVHVKVDWNIPTELSEPQLTRLSITGSVPQSVCTDSGNEADDVNRSLCINDLRNILRHLPRKEYKQFVGRIFSNGCQDNDTTCKDRYLILIDIVARIGDVTSQELVLAHILTKKPPVSEELRRVFIHCVALERPIQKFVRAIEGFCFGDHVISKRDTWLTDTEHEDHHISKAVLLHALGNAALTRSRRHLLDHAQPNRGHHVWRRAALDALRHYKCKEDEKHSVRQMALSVYATHPKRGEVTREKEDMHLSRNYTYPAVARVKRDIFETALLKLKIELPKLDWKKELGTRDVGASFGIYFNNYIHILFKVLSGYVDVNAEDKLWAEIHLGIINKQWDIIRVDACYRGRLKYNMNIVKDFTAGMAEDISSAFDHVINRIIEPIEKAANDLASKYQDPDTKKPKSGIDMIKSRINALFGQKFHPKFPDQRRDCDSSCGCGYYTGECRYGHPGVDLKWEPAWTIYSPVAGMMLPTKDPNSVLIRPATAGFTDYEIILSNIILNRTLSENETYVDAGQPIGTPAGANGCEDSHFHLAMKRNAPDSANGLCYYVDPSPFLDRMQPVPKWEEECKHFTFKHIFSTIDFAKLTEGFAEILEELKRIALDIGKQLLVKIVQALPDTGLLGPMKGIALDLVRNIDLDPANLKNLFKDGVNHAKKFFKNISTGQFSLGNIGNMMKGAGGTFGIDLLSKSLSSVKSGIGQAINFIKNPKLGKLGSFSTGGIGRLLSSRGLLPGLGKLDFGGLSGLTKKISSLVTGRKGLLSMLKASPPNLCPMFGKALSAAMSQSTCVPHEDCLGIDCDIDISASPFVKGKIDVTVRVDPEEREVRITSNGQENIVKGNGSQTIGGITVLNFIEVRFAVKAEWQGKELRFTLIIHPCAAPGCLDKITLMKEIQFDSKARQKRSTDELLGEFLGNMENLPIDEVTKMFADFNFDMDNIADQVNGIQGSIAEALTTNEDQAEPTMKSEFVNPLDHKDKGKFPVKDEDGSLYVPFFVFGFDYKLGPCGFVMKFDAGGAFGVSFDVNVQALDSQMKAVFTPWVSGKLRAELSLHFIIGEAGIKLTGYVMRTSFPLTIETKFRETPVQTTKRLEIELIPLELKLKAYLKILFVINVKRTIWHWRADPIRGTIWEKKDTKNDRGPPRFQYCDKVEENCYNKYLYDCELQEFTEGASAERKHDGHFVTYERLGKSFTAILRYENLPLRHGTRTIVDGEGSSTVFNGNRKGQELTHTIENYHASAYDKQSCTRVQLQHNTTYFSTVIANNKALNQKSSNATSNGVLVDITPPIPGNVSDGDDVINDIDFTSETATITTTWSDFQDPESGLTPYSLSVFVNQQLDKVFTDINAETFTDHSLSIQHGDSVYAVLLATNSRKSPPPNRFLVLKANIPGVVLDGSNEEDIDFSHDMGRHQYRFPRLQPAKRVESSGTKWGVGTTPFATDVLPYSDFGLVVDDQGNGFAEAHVTQFEGQTYYSTVRAITGHNCHEEYIVSSSDGFTLDTTPPSVTFHVGTRQVTSNQVVYQTQGNTLEVVWESEDASGINETRLTIGEFKENPKTVLVPAVLKDHITVATVRDGLGIDDKDFQETYRPTVCHWDAFGDTHSTLPSDQIVRYEVASKTVVVSLDEFPDPESGLKNVQVELF
nr:hypothetical protein BaRGS_032882 [Batillaria attramentaria]